MSDRLRKYDHWKFPVPPVCTVLWDDDAWERWILKYGVGPRTESKQ